MAEEKNDKHEQSAGGNLGDALISRRKLAYIAPLFVSRKMIYRAAGCAKVDPRIRTCSSSTSGS